MSVLWIWGIVIVVAIIIEFFTMELFSIWCAIGGLVGLILAVCGVSIEIQIICAVVVALVCILSLRKVSLKYLNKNSKSQEVEPFIGKQVKLLEDCSQEKIGTIKLNGVIWSAVSEVPIASGTDVEIVKVTGNQMHVVAIKKQENKAQETEIRTDIIHRNKN